MENNFTFEELDLPLHGVRLPSFNIDVKYKTEIGLAENSNNFDFLKGLCMAGFKKLNLKKDSIEYKKYVDRVKFELETIKELEFVDYILLVWSVIRFCKESSIPVGAGRGSAAGSLILFLIGVTRIDPIKYDLYFERFISKTRAKKQIVDGVTYLDGSLMCDVDIDICYYNRDKVIEHLETKFIGKTCKILTLNSLSGKLLIKECGKIVAAKSESEMASVSDSIPKIFGQVKDIESTYKDVPEFKEWCDNNKESYEIALKLRDLIKNRGVHPSGMLLSFDELKGNCPTELTSDKNIVSGFDMNWVSLFNIKLDLLGLRSVSVVDDVCRSIGIKIEDIDINDPFIYQNLQDLKSPHGLFQIEADTNFKVCQKVKPKNIEQLSAVLALARPGALQFADQYAKYTNTGEYQSVHSFFDDILNLSGGLCLFQEQAMKMLNKIGFSLEESENARRIIGKKDTVKVKEWQKKIEDKIKENNLPPEVGEVLWKILENSANYSFNKCLGKSTEIETLEGKKILKDIQVGNFIKAYDKNNNKDHFVEVLDKIHGEKELFEVELENGKIIECSLEHKFMCEDKLMRPLKDILDQNLKILTYFTVGIGIKSIKSIGVNPTIDLEVNHPDHNFYAEGLITSNSHAVSYAALAAITIYLKFKYPQDFYLSLLKMTRHEPDPISEIAKIQREFHYFNMKLLPPHLLKSDMDFKKEGEDIRFGLLSIKGISDKSIEKLNGFRNIYSNKFEIFQGAEEAGLSIGVLSSLIMSGCLDYKEEESRSLLVLEAQLWNLLTDKEKKYCLTLAPEYNFELFRIIKHLTVMKNEKGKVIIKPPPIEDPNNREITCRFNTIYKKYLPYREIYDQNSKNEDFANWYYQNKLLGYTYNKTLKNIFMEKVPDLENLGEISQARDGNSVCFVGVVKDVFEGISKAKKTKYVRLTVADESEKTTCLMFDTERNKTIEYCINVNGAIPKEDSIVIIRGQKKPDAIFINSIGIQDNKIFTKLSELKNSSKNIDKESTKL